MKEDFYLEKGMELEKNIYQINYYMMVNFQIIKEMEYVKNII